MSFMNGLRNDGLILFILDSYNIRRGRRRIVLRFFSNRRRQYFSIQAFSLFKNQRLDFLLNGLNFGILSLIDLKWSK